MAIFKMWLESEDRESGDMFLLLLALLHRDINRYNRMELKILVFLVWD